MTFQESGIQFDFDKNRWTVKKFDEHPYYQAIAGASMKGVDFIGIYQDKYLVLIEVKNYVDRFFPDKINPSEIFLEEINLRIPIFIKKFQDALKAIEVIHKYYQRKWWFRLLERYAVPHLTVQKLISWEWGFWLFAFLQMKKKPPIVQLVLWIEATGQQDWRPALEKTLKKRLLEKGVFALLGLEEEYLDIVVKRR